MREAGGGRGEMGVVWIILKGEGRLELLFIEHTEENNGECP